MLDALDREISRIAKRLSSWMEKPDTANISAEDPAPTSPEVEATPDVATKGTIGEHLIADTLEFAHIAGRVRLWLNVLVPKDNEAEDVTEIDVLMLHESGIYVFESKNYAGWIYGQEQEHLWTQALNKYEKNHFYNPVRQNASHIKHLSGRLCVPDDYFVSYIVFSDNCTLQKVPQGDDYHVLTYRELLPAVEQDVSRRSGYLNALQMRTLAERIEEFAKSSTTEAKEMHSERVKQAREGTICPLCGAELIERTGPYGAFLGCKNFPRCRFTRNLNKGS